MQKTFYYLTGALLIFGLQSFQYSDGSIKEIVQKAIELPPLEQILVKDSDGRFQSLTIVTNGQLPDDIHLQFAGQPVKIITGGEAERLDEEVAYLNVSEFGIKKKRARLHFDYNGVHVRINMRNIDGEWTYRSMSMKGKGIVYKDLDWTF
jgi:hypothetical protein